MKNIDTIKKAITEMEDCLDEAPVDFVGTGSWQSAQKEEKEWNKRKNAASEILNNIDELYDNDLIDFHNFVFRHPNKYLKMGEYLTEWKTIEL